MDEAPAGRGATSRRNLFQRATPRGFPPFVCGAVAWYARARAEVVAICAGDYLGGGYGGLFCGTGDGETSVGAAYFAEEDLGGIGWEHGWVVGCCLGISLLDSDSGGAFGGDGGDWKCGGADGGFAGVGV